jgi:Uma2 family endonuclease
MATTATMTGTQFDALPYEEGRRWELVNGELVPVPSPTFRHQDIGLETTLAFKNYFKSSGVRGLAGYDLEFALSDSDRVRPDVFVLLEEKATRLNWDKVPVPGPPDIAVEIISPSETADEIHNKVRRYLDSGTLEVWQVYPKSRSVIIHRSNLAREFGADCVISTDLLPGLSISVASLFA